MHLMMTYNNVSFIVVVLSGNLTAVVSVLNTIIIGEPIPRTGALLYWGLLGALLGFIRGIIGGLLGALLGIIRVY